MANHSNTARTIVGFFRSVLGRWIPFLSRNEQLSDIYNYLDIENLYATSGQPSATQFQLIKDAGYETVKNLAPTSMLENSVVEEEKILQELELKYIHIPVDFKNPTDEDFEIFVNKLESSEKVWVHCAANMRVSAFTYRYRKHIKGEEEATAKVDLDKIWTPTGVCSEFVKK